MTQFGIGLKYLFNQNLKRRGKKEQSRGNISRDGIWKISTNTGI